MTTDHGPWAMWGAVHDDGRIHTIRPTPSLVAAYAPMQTPVPVTVTPDPDGTYVGWVGSCHDEPQLVEHCDHVMTAHPPGWERVTLTVTVTAQ